MIFCFAQRRKEAKAQRRMQESVVYTQHGLII